MYSPTLSAWPGSQISSLDPQQSALQRWLQLMQLPTRARSGPLTCTHVSIYSPRALGRNSSPILPLFSPLLTKSIASAGPRYVVAFSVNTIMTFISILTATVLRLYLVRLNKRLDQGLAVTDVPAEPVGNGLPGEPVKKGFRFLV